MSDNKAKPETKRKEVWEMTRGEWVEAQGETVPEIDREKYIKAAEDVHKQAVENALANERTVPPEVLAEYPELSMGFITEGQIDAVIEKNRLRMCLVRCGGGRFLCPAQDVKHFINIITEHGGDYVRDVSLYRTSPAMA